SAVCGAGSGCVQPAAEIQVRDPAADGRDVPGLHHALHHLGAGRFQRRALHLRRRAGAVDACARAPGHPQRIRAGRSRTWHGDGADGAALADPAGDPADAPVAAQRGHDMTAQRRDRVIGSIGVWLLSAGLLVWTLLPIYNIIRVSMQEKEEVLSTSVYPIAPSTHAFSVVFRQAFWLLETFWNQMGNSFYIGLVVALLTLAIGSLASFTIIRMRIRSGWMLTNAALLTYVIPLSFLAIPFYGIMGKYGLTNSPLAVIAVEVTFATPYAIFIFQQYSASIPFE